MNILLINELPSKVKIGGIEVQINTDFRTSITFENLINDYDLEDKEEKKEFWDKSLKLYYPILNSNFDILSIQEKKIFNHIVDHVDEAIEKMMWFYRCGKELKHENSEGDNKQLYTYEHDGNLIYDAILSQYNIDLQKEENKHLHWWKFKSMFEGLTDNNKIKEIISIRAIDLNKIQDKNTKEHYRKLQKILAIPQDEEVIQSNKKFAELMKKGGDLSELKE